MAENNQVQLKREEIVDQNVVLSDINPITDTGSVVDETTGATLNRTLERILNAINNKLSRVVNSVNGRTGVVVIDKSDVGLDNVDNVSFDDIKRWVIDQLTKGFSKHTIKLFNNLQEAAAFAENHDETYSGTAFYSDHGYTSSMEYVDNRAHIGYFEWDGTTGVLTMTYRAISTIGSTDNSILYDNNVKGDFRGGMIGVNIWRYEDALKIYNSSSGEPATELSLLNSGLYIDKSKIAPVLYYFDGCYGNGDSYDVNALLYFQSLQPPGSIGITMTLNGNIICSHTSTYTRQTFKVNDLIICNFNDVGYYNADGTLISGINKHLVIRQPAIGKVVQAPTLANPSDTYIINFFTIKPLLGNGLTYNTNHSDTGEIPDNMASISPLQGSPLTNPSTEDIYDISGLVSFNDNERDSYGNKPTDITYNMSTPSGVKQVIHDDETNNGVAVNPANSLCILPSSQSKMDVDNVPTNTPINTDSTGKHVGGYVGVNLVKSLQTISDNLKGTNISGLRINNSIDTLAPEWFGNPELEYESLVHSGGLSVNVGDFLEIGNSINDILPVTPPALNNYYNSGKVNVRIDGLSLGNVGNNKLGVLLSNYVSYDLFDPNETLGGGLVYTNGYNSEEPTAQVSITRGLTINRGLGLRMSHYNRFGSIPEGYSYVLVTTEPIPFDPTEFWKKNQLDEWVQGQVGDLWEANTWFERVENAIPDKAFLGVSVIDDQYTDEDMGLEPDDRIKGFGGLRYFIGDSSINNQSAIGLRVNSSTDTYGHQLRLGEKAIGIDENNVVQVQRYRESDDAYKDTNPLVIKGWTEAAIYPYVKIAKLRGAYTVDAYDYLPGRPRNPYASPRTDKVYFVKNENRRYVWDGDTTQIPPVYEQMFITTNEKPLVGEWNKVYVENIINNTDHTYIGRAYKWQEQYTVYLPFSYDPTTHQYIDGSTYKVDAWTASKVLSYYAAQSVRDYEHDGYFINGEFYRDASQHAVLPTAREEGALYFDIFTKYPEVCYKYTNGEYVPLIKKPGTDSSVSHEDLIPCDVNNNGVIDSEDAVIMLRYFTFMSSAKPPEYEYFDNLTNQESLKEYVDVFYGIEEVASPGYVIVHATDENGSFMPGLDININENQGVTTRLNGDVPDSVSVKLFDSSSGGNIIVPEGESEVDEDLYGLYQGGLKFTTDGYLSIRVNDQRAYDATTPSGRLNDDWCRPKLNDDTEAQKLGARGLMVYPNNVLGIQLTEKGELDNGEFAFDEYGSLHISPNYQGGGGQTLTFTDGASHSITYNGHEPVTISLGPGLIIEEDEVTPEPTPEPDNDDQGGGD